MFAVVRRTRLALEGILFTPLSRLKARARVKRVVRDRAA